MLNRTRIAAFGTTLLLVVVYAAATVAPAQAPVALPVRTIIVHRTVKVYPKAPKPAPVAVTATVRQPTARYIAPYVAPRVPVKKTIRKVVKNPRPADPRAGLTTVGEIAPTVGQIPADD